MQQKPTGKCIPTKAFGEEDVQQKPRGKCICTRVMQQDSKGKCMHKGRAAKNQRTMHKGNATNLEENASARGLCSKHLKGTNLPKKQHRKMSCSQGSHRSSHVILTLFVSHLLHHQQHHHHLIITMFVPNLTLTSLH